MPWPAIEAVANAIAHSPLLQDIPHCGHVDDGVHHAVSSFASVDDHQQGVHAAAAAPPAHSDAAATLAGKGVGDAANHQTAQAHSSVLTVQKAADGDYPGVDPEVLKLQGAKVAVDLMNNNNSQYYGDIAIGSKNQHFTAVYDTGSAITWIPGDKCKSQTCLEHHRFAQGDSDTFQPTPQEQINGQIQYGTGTVKYEGGNDVLSFCDSHHNTGCHGKQDHMLQAPAHPIGLSTAQSSNPFRILPFDGIMGLAPSINEGSVLHALKASHALDKNMVGMYFSDDPHRVGSVAFGGVEPTHIAPDSKLHWFPIRHDREWNISLKDIEVDGKRLHICDEHQGGVCPAIVDTGSSLITGPSDEVSKLLPHIRTPEDCSTTDKMPKISIVLTDKDFHEVKLPLDPQEYTLRSWDEVPQQDPTGFKGEFAIVGKGDEPKIVPHCEPGVGIMDVPGKKWVLGNTLLRRYYSIYDDDHGQVGFVRSIHPGEAVPSSSSATSTGASGTPLSQASMGEAGATLLSQAYIAMEEQKARSESFRRAAAFL